MNTKKAQVIDIDEIRRMKEIQAEAEKQAEEKDKSILERIEAYIKNTKYKRNDRYTMSCSDAFAIGDYTFNEKDLAKGLLLAFNYGHAKGYRQAKAEFKK